MAYAQLHDLITRIRDVQSDLITQLEALHQTTEDSRIRSMLEAAQREEREMSAIFADVVAGGTNSPTNVWLQYVPDEDVKRVISETKFTTALSADEVVLTKIEFDQALLIVFQVLESRMNAASLKEFLHDLHAHVETRIKRQAWRVREYQPDQDPPRIPVARPQTEHRH